MVSNVTIQNSYAIGIVKVVVHGDGVVGARFRTGDMAILQNNYCNVLVQTVVLEGGLIGQIPNSHSITTTMFTENNGSASLYTTGCGALGKRNLPMQASNHRLRTNA